MLTDECIFPRISVVMYSSCCVHSIALEVGKAFLVTCPREIPACSGTRDHVSRCSYFRVILVEVQSQRFHGILDRLCYLQWNLGNLELFCAHIYKAYFPRLCSHCFV